MLRQYLYFCTSKASKLSTLKETLGLAHVLDTFFSYHLHVAQIENARQDTQDVLADLAVT